ncbi:hypothetical protein DEJ28_02450 [Curtobacterium sp. MCPF17_002]|uniref:hypothetical protein n=1 Tax=Curtobacterium sp. MCPF17_002 TaxID=2175645 RepID=UPI000DAA41B3|nr:hypothetical protein [Curtobacterium sp. MCPF17_002]WIB77978.1 hypothetical protein DEJ28_02450 [Curtobacterium sp. MCPF17_002]
MKYIHYNGQPTMVADDVADAVIEYAAVLGSNNRTDTIDVPTFDETGQPAVETLLVGPASQITISPAPEDELEDDHEGFVQHLRELAAAAGPARPVHEDRNVSASDPKR